ncbi:peptidyl-prolyl cis-trans isomerase [Fragilaria crotonensis]|nr:peptidyl-prolyl cis-trans isomerase [Fragilaria crotonensis]
MVPSCILLLLVAHVLNFALAEDIKVSFINFSEKAVELFWFDESSGSEVAVDSLVPLPRDRARDVHWNSLTQFGIGADYELRTEYRTANIKDDAPKGIAFQPGYMSYAGSGPDSRSSEIFIVMPDTGEAQLAYFGKENSWETPFGFVEPESMSTVAQWYDYGDMPPWGSGPDPQLIYEEDGYEYLKREFPKLSYINECRILSSESNDGTEEL